MALARIKTWIAGDTLTAADLNAEFNNLLNNPISLVSPTTGAINFQTSVAHTNLVPTALTVSSGSTGQALIVSSSGGAVWGGPPITKGWATFTSSAGLQNSFNVSSITVNSSGDYTVNWSNAMASSFYAVLVSIGLGTTGSETAIAVVTSIAVGSARVAMSRRSDGTTIAVNNIHVVAYAV